MLAKLTIRALNIYLLDKSRSKRLYKSLDLGVIIISMGFFGSLIDLFGRIFISSLFIVSSVEKIFNYESSLEYILDYNLPSFLLSPSIVVEILFPLCIIVGYKTKISAFILALFTITLAFIFHFDFTNPLQTTMFLKNIAISGGLLFLITKDPGRFSVDE